MSGSIDSLTDDDYRQLLQPLWTFLARTDRAMRADAVFVFGSRDLAVPRRAAALYAEGFAPRVLVTGRFGLMTEGVFPKAEALVFSDELVRLGVPNDVITTEVDAGNTLENVRFGMTALRAAGCAPRAVLLVAKAFVMRRCLATFARQYPDIAARGCPPDGPLMAHLDRPRAAFAARLVAELHRLDTYAASGDIAPQIIPARVRETAERIAAACG